MRNLEAMKAELEQLIREEREVARSGDIVTASGIGYRMGWLAGEIDKIERAAKGDKP